MTVPNGANALGVSGSAMRRSGTLGALIVRVMGSFYVEGIYGSDRNESYSQFMK